MKQPDTREQQTEALAGWRWALVFIAIGVLVAVLSLVSRHRHQNHEANAAPTVVIEASKHWTSEPVDRHGSRMRGWNAPGQGNPSAEEIVAKKLSQFARGRHELVYALAKRFKVEVPEDVERFFAAVERGKWEEIDAAHAALLAGGDLTTPRSSELHSIWRAIQETWGVARESHDWPAQKLLDYGNAVLGSLRPGMIYVGGTDPGCFIPTFLNETGEGERHVVLTQNALADGYYLDYLNYLYGDRMTTLTHEDSQKAFEEYLADAKKRAEHDQQFPDEAKQVRPGEEIRLTNGGVSIGGQIAVMSINEKMFQMLMEKNPDASFAMEQSFPFKSVYANATPLGPIMELRVQDQQNALTPERARASVEYWRDTARELQTSSEDQNLQNPRMAYAKMASEQAALLLDRNYTQEAEETLRVAVQIAPSSPEALFRYIDVLTRQSRAAEGIPMVEAAIKAAPENPQFQSLLAQLKTGKK